MLVDTDGLTVVQLRSLVQELQSLIDSAIEAEESHSLLQQAREQLANSEGALSALIGPEGLTEPTIDNINGLVLYPDALLIEHAALVFRQILAGMKILAENQRTVARITRVNLDTE